MAVDPHKGQFALRMNGATGVAHAIEVVTQSHTHHVVVGLGDGLVASAEPWHGVVIRHESDYPDLVWSRFEWTEEEAERIASVAKAAKGTGYNYLAFVSMGGFGLFGYHPPVWLTKIITASKRVDCSELVVESFVGVQLFTGPRWMVTPGDLEAYCRAQGWDMTPVPTTPPKGALV